MYRRFTKKHQQKCKKVNERNNANATVVEKHHKGFGHANYIITKRSRIWKKHKERRKEGKANEAGRKGSCEDG